MSKRSERKKRTEFLAAKAKAEAQSARTRVPAETASTQTPLGHPISSPATTRVESKKPQTAPSEQSQLKRNNASKWRWKYPSAGDMENRGFTDDERKNWILAASANNPNHRHCFLYRARHWFWASWYNIAIPLLKRGTTLLTLTKWLLSLFHLFGPIVIIVLASKNWHDIEHLVEFAAVYLVVMWAAERVHKAKERAVDEKLKEASRTNARAAWEKAHHELVRLFASVQNSKKKDIQDRAKSQIVSWAAEAIMQRGGEYWDAPTINIFIFSNAELDTLKACVRSTVGPEQKPTIALSGSLLFWAVKLGRCIIVPCMHYSWHPFDMILDSSSKSKVLKPLTEYSHDGERYCYGVISVESRTPFYFNSRRWQDIDDIVELLASLVQIVIGEPQFKRKVER